MAPDDPRERCPSRAAVDAAVKAVSEAAVEADAAAEVDIAEGTAAEVLPADFSLAMSLGYCQRAYATCDTRLANKPAGTGPYQTKFVNQETNS